MEIIYKWLIKDYNWKEFWWFAIINDSFYIEDENIWKIDWKYSEKKKKFYANKVYERNWKYEFIIFKNWYIIIWFTQKYEAQEWDASF